MIDEDSETYSVERLHALKRDHEAWVASMVLMPNHLPSWGLSQLYAWFRDSMTIKNAKDPSWVGPLVHVLVVFLGGYFTLYAILHWAKLASYIFFSHGADVTLPKKLAAMLLAVIILVSARICGVAVRESWWHLKGLWQSRGIS